MASVPRIPYPPLTQRYVALKDRPSAERLASARTTTAAQLAAEFLDAVAAFETFDVEGDERDTRFLPATRTDGPKHPKSHARTYGWAMAVKATDPVEVAGARQLDFRYVAREIIPTRTRPGLPFAAPGSKHVRVDLVLANAHSARPIVGELKIADDKDPFTGLVQALAGTAQLTSVAQRARLDRLAADAGRPLARRNDEPLLDVYVLLGDFPTRGRDRFVQLERALTLAGDLEADAELGRLLGHVRVLALARSSDDRVRASTTLLARRAAPA